ncbi:Fc.00g004070.m01.CDS01 [Cosmosporella sp. VM-42]
MNSDFGYQLWEGTDFGLLPRGITPVVLWGCSTIQIIKRRIKYEPELAYPVTIGMASSNSNARGAAEKKKKSKKGDKKLQAHQSGGSSKHKTSDSRQGASAQGHGSGTPSGLAPPDFFSFAEPDDLFEGFE